MEKRPHKNTTPENETEEVKIVPNSTKQEHPSATTKATENSKKNPFEKKLQEVIKKEGDDFYNSEDINKINNILKEFADKDPKFKAALNGVYLADKLNSKILGKIVYHNFKKIKPNKGREFTNKIPNEYAFDATTEAGFHTFVSWDTLKGNFYIESTKNIDKIIQKINNINPESGMSTIIEKENGNQIIGKINNMTEAEFKEILLMDNNQQTNKKEDNIKATEAPIKQEEKEPETKAEVNPEVIPQTERQKRIAELLESQEERTKEIEKIEHEIKKLSVILEQMQAEELK